MPGCLRFVPESRSSIYRVAYVAEPDGDQGTPFRQTMSSTIRSMANFIVSYYRRPPAFSAAWRGGGD
jgi:hypothetical protein